MNIDQAFPSKYIKCADLDGKRIRLTISHCEMESVDPKEEDKAVLYFKSFKKGLILNRTNANMVASLYGKESDEWVGKTILLVPEKTNFQGKLVDCVRIHAAPAQPGKKPEPPPVQEGFPDQNLDEPPF